MNADERRLNRVTECIIGCACTLANRMGVGYLEKVYENSMMVELRNTGLRAEQQYPINVYSGDVLVGQYTADLYVEECVLVELKVAKAFDDIHVAQCLNYLKATGFRICLLVNFGRSRIEIKRIVNHF